MKKETIEQVLSFRDQRNWKQFHNPKDLALSLSLEASELLELYQWRNGEEVYQVDRTRISEELADVLCYAISLADVLSLDLDEIILEKLEKNGRKYPVELSRGSKKKYDELKREARKKEDL